MNEKLKFFVEGTFAQTEKIKVPFLILFIVTLILWLSLPVFGLLGAALGWFATVGTFVFVLSDLFCLALLSQKRVFCLKRLVVVLVGFLLLTKGHQFRHDHWFLHDLKPKFEQELASWRTNKARLTGAAVQQTVVFGSTNSDGKIFATFHLPGKIPRENFLYTESILSAEELKNYGTPRMVTANWCYFN